ncbi:30726_t:CDS:1, partial [Racocetra persica]
NKILSNGDFILTNSLFKKRNSIVSLVSGIDKFEVLSNNNFELLEVVINYNKQPEGNINNLLEATTNNLLEATTNDLPEATTNDLPEAPITNKPLQSQTQNVL